jgi:hypothetical protein
VATSPTISSVFPKHLFWDLDYTELSVDRDDDIIIPRALYFTDSRSFNEDISRLEIFYKPQQIVQQLQNTKELISNEVCAMVAERYHVPPFHRFSIR